MSGVVLALLVFIVAAAAHVVFSHLVRAVHRERVLIRFMLAASIIYIVAYPFALPILARIAGSSSLPRVLNFLGGLAGMGFLVLGYAEFWSIVERSVSLRLLIDVSEAPAGLARDELGARYSGGRGLRWLMDKRVDDLVGSGMVERQGATLRMTRRGHLVGLVFRAVRAALLMR